MKRGIKNFAILLVLITSTLIFPRQTSAQQANVNFQVFYDELSPYGQWVDYKNYGYVWIPDEGSDFVPYSTNGHWIYTEYGWTWVSNYEWGWAPFHYGRWDYDNYYGWLWIPDNEWGPSWVNWRRADGYYGWSPMEPGISLTISFGRPYNRDNDHWMFVRDRDFERPDINRYYVNRTDHDRIIRSSTVINTTYIDNSRHTTYVTGPARTDVQRVTGRRINPVAIRENNRPGQQMNNGQLQIYRPQVSKNNNNNRKLAPSRVTKLNDVKRPSERNAATWQRDAKPQNGNDQRTQPAQQQRNTSPADVERQQQQRQQQQQQEAKQQQQQRQQRQQEQRQQQQQQEAKQQQQQRQQEQRQKQQAQPQQQRQQQEVQQQQQRQQEQRQQQQPHQQRQQQQPQQQQAQPQEQRQQQQQAQPQRQQPNTASPQGDKKQQPTESKSEQDKKLKE